MASKGRCLHCLDPNCRVETCPTTYRCNTKNMAKLVPCSNPLCYNDSFKQNHQLPLCPLITLPIKKSNYKQKLSKLIESKKNQDQDYLGLIGINLNDKKYFTTDHPFYQLFYNYPQLLENFVKINMPEVNTIGEPDKNNRNLILQQFKEELIKNNPKNIQELIFKAFQKINPDMMVVDRTGTQRNVFQKLYSLIETISLREKENK